jgi:ribosomal protein S18 acetylase RimI-like enzyme
MVIEIVDNDPKYYEFIRLLRNDPSVQDGFIDNREITKEAQILYMQQYKNNYIVALLDGNPVGYAGSIEKDIRVCVKPEAQNKGIGRALIDGIMKRFPGSYAKIKINNEASKSMFIKCGFKEIFVIMEKINETQSI